MCTRQLCILFTPPPSPWLQISSLFISRSRLLTCSAISSLLSSSVASPHTFHDSILSLFFASLLISTLLLSSAPSLSLLLLCSFVLSFFPFSVYLLSVWATTLVYPPFPLGHLLFTCLPLSPFTLGLRLLFVIRLAIHTLHPTSSNSCRYSACPSTATPCSLLVLAWLENVLPSFLLFLLQSNTVLLRRTFHLNSIIVVSLGIQNVSNTSNLPFPSLFIHPPCLTVSLLISSDNISCLFALVSVVGPVQVSGTSQSWYSLRFWGFSVILPANHTK